MRKPFLIVKNITREGPGLLEEVLIRQNIPYALVDLDNGEAFPSPKDYAALVVLGGPDSANDQTEKITAELDKIREALAAGIPYLGICLGLQLLVKAAGGHVVKNHVPEIGFRDPNHKRFTVDLTPVGSTDPLFAGLKSPFQVFHLHGETVELTPDMLLLGTGQFCQHQIVKAGANAYGIQCHFELTPEMFDCWITEDPDLKQLDTAGLREDFRAIQADYRHTGIQLLQNFIKVAGYS